MDLSVVYRQSSRRLGINAVFWSAVGGIELGRGIQQLIHEQWQHMWIVSFLTGSVFLAFGIFWAVILVRRAGAAPQVTGH